MEPKRVEVDGYRFYIQDNKPYIGVTTANGIVTPNYLKDWFKNCPKQMIENKLKSSSERGTAIHELCEKLSKKEEYELPSDPSILKILIKLQNYIAKFNSFKVLHTELPLYSNEHMMAGTVDLICEVDGQVEVWDYKSGNKSIQHGWQLGAYTIMIKEQLKLEPKQLRCIYVSPEHGFSVTNYSPDRIEYLERIFLHALMCAKGLLHQELYLKGIPDNIDSKIKYKGDYSQLTAEEDSVIKHYKANTATLQKKDT